MISGAENILGCRIKYRVKNLKIFAVERLWNRGSACSLLEALKKLFTERLRPVNFSPAAHLATRGSDEAASPNNFQEQD